MKQSSFFVSVPPAPCGPDGDRSLFGSGRQNSKSNSRHTEATEKEWTKQTFIGASQDEDRRNTSSSACLPKSQLPPTLTGQHGTRTRDKHHKLSHVVAAVRSTWGILHLRSARLSYSAEWSPHSDHAAAAAMPLSQAPQPCEMRFMRPRSPPTVGAYDTRGWVGVRLLLQMCLLLPSLPPSFPAFAIIIKWT